MKKKIPLQYFESLKTYGHTVARFEKTGEVIPFQVGKEYIICNSVNKETIKVRCTQNNPCHIKRID